MQDRVALERRRRGLSVRRAAQIGGVSNTTWSRYEESGHLTDSMRVAVAKVMGWRTDWPESPPPDNLEEIPIERTVRAELDLILTRLAAVEQLASEAAPLRLVERNSEQLVELAERLRRVEGGGVDATPALGV